LSREHSSVFEANADRSCLEPDERTVILDRPASILTPLEFRHVAFAMSARRCAVVVC
jgi:hypothetical protein